MTRCLKYAEHFNLQTLPEDKFEICSPSEYVKQVAAIKYCPEVAWDALKTHESSLADSKIWLSNHWIKRPNV